MPTMTAQTKEIAVKMIQSRAGKAPKDLRSMPQIQTVKAVKTEARRISKQTVSSVVLRMVQCCDPELEPLESVRMTWP